ncbi:MAG: quinone oxidoreductase [Ktedonobacterales bacterium]|nr:quinone oxidoreductase [Ktedonobacterales bacterium]
MKALRIHAHGGPEVLRYEDIPTPEAGPGQARVRIEAAGVNFIDVYHRTGQYQVPLPMTLGQEGGGVVDAVGAGVTSVAVGDRVAYASIAGGYAEYAVVPADRLVVVPAAVPMRDAVAVMLQGMTAHYLTHSTFPLKAGDTALVHAAAGGVGLLLTQLATGLGARVIATTSTEEKAQLARAAGATDVIRYDQEAVAPAVRRLTDGRGVEVVYDSVGKDTFAGSLDSLRPRGYLVLFGQSSGAVPPFNIQTLNAKGSLFLTRPTLAHYIATREELMERSGDLFAQMAAGTLHVRIGATYPLAEGGAAQEALTGRQTTGKVLLLP